MKVIAVLLVALALATVSAVEPAVEPAVESFDSGVDFPYAVSCKFQTLIGQTPCGGTIISSKRVLTTAKCMERSLWVTIYGGSNSFLSGILTRTVLAIFFIKHPNYDPITLDNNLGLIPVLEITFNSNIGSVNLPPPDFTDYPDDTYAVSVGWGRSASPGQPIQGLNVQVKSSITCFQEIPNFSSSYLCAVATDTGIACQGSQGGALMENNTMIGVVSWGILPCSGGTPAVYSRVSAFVNWINSNWGL